MSANIDIGKMKFSLFGRGYDDDRLDSGNGDVIVLDSIPFAADFGAIDETGQYAWLASGNGVHKYDLTDLSEVAQTILTANTPTTLYHPTNVPNNYGIAFQGTTCTVFDLTDDTIIRTGTVSNPVSASNDTYLDGNIIYFVTVAQGRSTQNIKSLDITDLTMTNVAVSNVGSCGFTNKNILYMYQPPEWYYQRAYIYGINKAGSTIWTVTSAGQGSSAFPNIGASGFTGKDHIYLPVYKYSAWRMGVFRNQPSDFETPKPLSIFGKFPSMPTLANVTIKYSVAHTNGRTKTAFGTDQGVYVTDYKDLTLLDSEISFPVAIDENTLLCKGYTTPNTLVYRSV